MRRVSVLLSVVGAVLIGLVVIGWSGPVTRAQEGTPAAEEGFAPEGVSFEPLAFGTAAELPATPVDLVLIRFGIEPGAGFPIEADDPTVALAYVQSGVLTVRVEAPMQVIRAATIAAFATPGAVEEDALPAAEEIAAGTEFTLAAGDSTVFPPNVAGEIRNDGQERAEALVTLIAPPAGDGATPAP